MTRLSRDVFVSAAALEIVLDLAGETENRTLAEVDAMASLWSSLVPAEEAARRIGENLGGICEAVPDDAA